MADQQHEFSPAQWEFLSVLDAFGEPVHIDIVSLIAPLTPGALFDLIRYTTNAGWLVHSDDNLVCLNENVPEQVSTEIGHINTADKVSSILDKLKDLDLLDQLSPDIQNNLLEKSEQPYEACMQLYDLYKGAMERKDLEGAMLHLDDIVSRLQPRIGEPQYDAIFVQSVLDLSYLRSRLLTDLGGLTDLLEQAIEAAKRMGDRRSQALLSLHMGRLSHFNEKFSGTLGILSSGLEQVRKLGDEDIVSRAEEFQGLYCYIQGMYDEAAKHLEQAVQKAIAEEVPSLVSYHTPIYLAICTALLGQFHRSVGVLDGYWRRSQIEGAHMMSTLFRAMLGTVLLMMGKNHEALSHLRSAEIESKAQKNYRAVFWAQRAISYNLFLEGRIRESYEMAMENLERDKYSHSQLKRFVFPWMLEMLYEFHKRGYKPLPTYDFEQQMEKIINGININLRGVALRIRALQAAEENRDAAYIKAILERSEADLKRSGDPIQLAKTRVEMASLRLNGGDREGAQKLALQAWELLSGYGQGFLAKQFPQDILTDLLGIKSLREVQSQDDEFLERFIDMVDDFFPSLNLDDLLARAIAAISRFFGAERGGMFMFEGERPQLRTGYNLTRTEVETETFRANLDLVVRAYRNNQPLIVHPRKSPGKTALDTVSAILCLPFERKSDHIRGVFYHDCTYTDHTFDFLDRSMLVRIAHRLSIYTERIEDYFRTLEMSTRAESEENASEAHMEEWEIKTRSPIMIDLLNRANQVADSGASVLILGETGVGKELLARHIHAMSPYSSGPFIEVDLSSIPETLVESEMFGHEKGAFTGADHQKKGRIELAHKGTLFIDEVGDIPRAIQLKLLRALQERTFVRVGGTRKLTSDFRLVAATNRDLEKAVEEGEFREDLYYRLNVVPLTVPALKDRGRDVLFLAQYFLEYYARKYKRRNLAFRDEDKTALREYHWPGNVRELKNVIERGVILSSGATPELKLPMGAKPDPSDQFAARPTLEGLQRMYINHILNKTGGRISGPGGAAEILGIKRTTLYSRMKNLGLV
ncbi:MAG TPA: sigma 54-interacting transcriptional regulator [Deltaproteobacteria bacterium]|nr:sigma 54-interacting transcriptional regulator [Deltaproteobacteria bacterium]HPJ93379.1 sigma 54-interacting transcriptional regulator [Deltaproteobacteria bacterium]HPR51545.1 sigma 54-interacting transcriptional regulator [Deltaproteobacteria bacterium]